MERISGEKQSHGEKRGPWEKDSHGESFGDGENCGYNGNGMDHNHEDGKPHDGLTSGRYGSGD